MKTEVYLKRLLKLADFLDKLPRKRFDFGCWVGEDWQGKQDLSCGTSACALGWAATMPEFRRLGLRLKRTPGCNMGYVASKNHDETEYAAKEIFGVGIDAFYRLFTPGYLPDNATPKQVAKNIRKYVAEKRASE